MDIITQTDIAILNFIHTHLSCAFLDAFFTFITHLGDGGIFWILAGLLLLIRTDTRKIGVCVLASLVLGLIFTNLGLKNIVARTRPYYLESAAVTAEDILIKLPSDFSFPSGHTTASVAASFSIFFKDRRLGTAALIIAALIAFSRLYLYVHMPTDILGGAAIGALAAYLASVLCGKAYAKIERMRR